MSHAAAASASPAPPLELVFSFAYVSITLALQTRKLVMVALGVQGLLPPLEDGIHLRWQMDLTLGFPPLVSISSVARIEHARPRRSPRRARPDGTVTLGVPFDVVSLRVRSGGAGVAVVLFDGGRMLAPTPLAGAGIEMVLTFQADAIDEIALPPGSVVLEARGTRVAQDADLGWDSPLNGTIRIGVPLTDAAYQVTHAHAPDDWAEPVARLSRRVVAGGPLSLPPELASRSAVRASKTSSYCCATSRPAPRRPFPRCPATATGLRSRWMRCGS